MSSDFARIIGLALMLIPPSDGVALAASIKQTFPAEALCAVVSVIDGDTLKCYAPALDLDDQKPMCRTSDGTVIDSCWSVRLLRIDTGETTYHDPKAQTKPRWTCEAEHEAGIAAKERITELVRNAGGVVVLTKIQRDYYPARRDAEVTGGGVNFSDVLLRENLAAPYKGSAKDRKKKWCHPRQPLHVVRPGNPP